LQIKGLLKLPSKKAENKTLMNQQLALDCVGEMAIGAACLAMAHRNTSFVHK
jgi:hypothetical protein